MPEPMPDPAFDTLEASRDLQPSGFADTQANAVVGAIRIAMNDVARTSDIQRLDQKIGLLDEKIDTQYTTLNEKIDTHHTALNEKIDSQATHFTDPIRISSRNTVIGLGSILAGTLFAIAALILGYLRYFYPPVG